MSIPQRTMPGEARPVQWLCAGLGLSLIRRSCSLRWGGSCLRGGRVDEVEL